MPCILNVGIIGLIYVDYDNPNVTYTPDINKHLSKSKHYLSQNCFETLNNFIKSYSVYVQSRTMVVPDADPLLIYSKY